MPERFPIHRILSVGVEEEFVLCDARTRLTVGVAPEVLTKAQRGLAERVHHEFYATQIEINSRPHTSGGSLREDLVQARQIVAAAASSAGAMLVASGTSALTGSPLPATECDRYAAMSLAFPDVVRQTSSEFCGCHVHLGILTRSEALALSYGLRPWLPVIQALAVNSPYCAAGDSGCTSSRYFQQRRWPTVGPAPLLVDNAEYEQVVRQLSRDRRILDRGMVYWYARPSEHLPTLEVRVADVNADLDVTVLIAMLLRGLGTMILARFDAGFANPRPVSRRRLVQAHHSVARHGLAGWTVDPVEGRSSPVPAQLSHQLEFARPALDAAGDTGAVQHAMTRVLTEGTGAQRQQADFQSRRSLIDVVDRSARRTTAG